MTREVLSNGVIVPEKYTRDWFDDFRTNLVKLNDAITAIAGKQNALTQEQLDAVNSAITSQKVTAYDDHIADTSKHLTDGTASKAIADEDGTSIKTGYVNVAGNQTVTGDKSFTGSNTFNNILPNATNTYSLGTSSYQWSSVYAQTYYYNGTEFQSKFVTTDTEQTITSLKTISISSSPQLRLKNTGINLNNVSTTGYRTASIRAIDKNDTTLGQISWNYQGSDNTGRLNLTITSRDAEVGGIYIQHNGSDSTTDIIPHDTVNAHNLGTSTNKWKTLNGVNPGALSLPDINTSIAVDTTNWVYDGATFNEIKINDATQTISGWLYIIINNASSDDVIVVRYAGSGSDNLTYAQYKSGLSYVSLVSPIMPGVKTYVTSRKAFSTIKIYRSLGNV